MTGAIVVFTTAGSAKDAEAIADLLIERRLAACVQMSPIRSKYAWKGEVACEDETLLTIKTLEALYERVEAAIREASSYELPEVLAQPVVAGSKAYLDWIAGQVSGA